MYADMSIKKKWKDTSQAVTIWIEASNSRKPYRKPPGSNRLWARS